MFAYLFQLKCIFICLIWEIIKLPTISKYSNEIWKPEIIFV